MSDPPDRKTVLGAISRLLRSDEELAIVPQNLYEFWAAATRRAGSLSSGGQNGLGMSIDRAALWLRRIQNFCRVLPERPEIPVVWQGLVIAHRVSGFKSHDLRLIAAMNVHGIQRVLTFNVKHFSGFGVQVVDPKSV